MGVMRWRLWATAAVAIGVAAHVLFHLVDWQPDPAPAPAVAADARQLQTLSACLNDSLQPLHADPDGPGSARSRQVGHRICGFEMRR